MATDKQAGGDVSGRRWWWAAVIVAAAAVAAYSAAAFAVTGSTGRTASFGEQRGWGGLSAGEVRERLDTVAASTPRTVVVGDVTDQIVPARAGLNLDVGATARRATEMSWDPRVLAAKLLGSYPIEPVSTVDEDKLAMAVRGLASRVDADPVDGAVEITQGRAEVTEAANGQRLQRSEAARVLAARWAVADTIELPAAITPPDITAQEVADVLEDFVRPALAAPITASVGGSDVSVPVQAFAPALRVVAQDGELATEVNGDTLRRVIIAQAPTLARAAREASIAIVDGAPQITPSLTGAHLDATHVSTAVRSILTEPPGANRTAVLQVQTEEPNVTTEQIKALGISERISEFSTPAYGPWGRTENIRVAARKVDGYVLRPAETFSLNDILGERTRANGYHAAPVIEDGRLVQGLGGGVSQVATTLFNGMFFAGLEDVEHHPHSIYFSRYPEGREATLAWGAKDLRFRNDTEHGVLIQIYLSEGRLRTVFWGTKTYDIESVTGKRHNFREPAEFTSDDPRCVDQSPKPGFDVDVTRVFRRDGAVTRRQTFSTRYRPEDEVTCVEPGEQTASASASS